jgi:hypothetical protein
MVGYDFERNFGMVNLGYTYLEYQLNTYFIMPYNIIKTCGMGKDC